MTAGLLALGLAAMLALILILAFPSILENFWRIIGGTLILVLGLTLFALLVIAIFDIDVEPFLRKTSVMLTGNRVVDFYAIFPSQDRVVEVDYVDTDGDDQKEWVVFYQFDLTDGRSPYAGTVYDYDRGDPPLVFPYQLLPPDRDYLSEGEVRLELTDIAQVGGAQPEPELMVYGQVPSSEEAGGTINTDLNIFRHIPNSFAWELPRDEPRRYQVIGAFRGDGGVTFDPDTKNVTVLNREDYDRSQIAVRSVYAIDKNRGTYMSVADPRQLSAPISSEVIFASGMPPDVLATPYPEKLLLGFYEMLSKKDPAVHPRDFLTGEALTKYNENDLEYFGFGNVTGIWADVEELTVTQLSYTPDTEQIDPSITYLGTEPRFQTAGVAFVARVNKNPAGSSAPIIWVMTVVNGQWKIWCTGDPLDRCFTR